MKLPNDKVVELLEVGGIGIGNGAEIEFARAPLDPLIAMPRPRLWRDVSFPCKPDEYVD
jgi:hypothetical protein